MAVIIRKLGDVYQIQYWERFIALKKYYISKIMPFVEIVFEIKLKMTNFMYFQRLYLFEPVDFKNADLKNIRLEYMYKLKNDPVKWIRLQRHIWVDYMHGINSKTKFRWHLSTVIVIHLFLIWISKNMYSNPDDKFIQFGFSTVQNYIFELKIKGRDVRRYGRLPVEMFK